MTTLNNINAITGQSAEFDSKLNEITETQKFLLSRTHHRPKIAIICGTGFGGLADLLEDVTTFTYEDIPHFEASSVVGHAGKLMFGKIGDKVVVCMKGRIHAYEGYSMWKITFPVRVFAALGVEILLATNACGALNNKFGVGDLMIMKDHINLPGMAGLNPMVGLNDSRFGVRYQELTTAYDRDLRRLGNTIANQIGMKIREGVYCVQVGPCFETIAEVRMMQRIGADVAGMSTVPEVMVARHCGLRCFGVSMVTNICVDDYEDNNAPSEEDINDIGDSQIINVQKFFSSLVEQIQLKEV